jgi:ubiquinone/menaquinone biosynthesis C-methylase UbiE
LTEEIRAFYDQTWHDGVSAHAEDVRRRGFHVDSLAYALSCLEPLASARVVELGPGHGIETLRMAERGAEVWAIDLSGVGLNHVRRRAVEQGWQDRIVLVQADAHSTGLNAGSFDRVFAQTMLMHVDARQVVREAARLLKPGGRAVFLEPLNGHPLIASYRLLGSPYRALCPRYVRWHDVEEWGRHFRRWRRREFYLWSVLGLPFVGRQGHVPAWLRSLQEWDSRLLYRRPASGRWAWMTVFVGEA